MKMLFLQNVSTEMHEKWSVTISHQRSILNIWKQREVLIFTKTVISCPKIWILSRETVSLRLPSITLPRGLIFNMSFRTHKEKGCWETFPLRWTDERSLRAAEQGGGEEDANWGTPAATTQHQRPEYKLAGRQADTSEFRKTGAAKEGRTDRA